MSERPEYGQRELSTSDVAQTSAEAEAEGERSETRPGAETQATPQRAGGEEAQAEAFEPLLPQQEAGTLRQRWEAIQTAFVDEPQNAVQRADGLVAEVLQRVAETFSSERQTLEGQWGRGEDVSTEDLRLILQRYRSFFVRLLSA